MKEDLGRILRVFELAGVPFELIGGVAVNVHLMRVAQRSRSFLTRDIDVLVRRSDLQTIIEAASSEGYEARKRTGGYALLQPGQSLSEAIHLLFVGEKPKSSYPASNPDLRPEEHVFLEMLLPVAPVADLIALTLNSLRPKDVVHLDILDEVGFITPEVEATLTPRLRDHLKLGRSQFERESAYPEASIPT